MPRGRFDIAHPRSDPFPEPCNLSLRQIFSVARLTCILDLFGYLNQHWVQAALGVPLNHTPSSRTVATDFRSTGDYPRGTSLESLAYLLDNGVKVAGVYGDRDWACNWIGGERAVHAVDYSGAEEFKRAGYEPIVYGSNNTIGGQVKQFGNYSFSRVYQAGHEGKLSHLHISQLPRYSFTHLVPSTVPSYQPEISYEIFSRTTFNKDVKTGVLKVHDDYITVGPKSIFHIKNEVPEWPESSCYILSPGTCSEEQWAQVLNGTALIKDFKVVEYDVKEENVMGVNFEEPDNGDGQKILRPN